LSRVFEPSTVYIVYIREPCILFGEVAHDACIPSNLLFMNIKSAHRYMRNNCPQTPYMIRETPLDELRRMPFISGRITHQ